MIPVSTESALEKRRGGGVKWLASPRTDGVRETRMGDGILDTNTDVWVGVEGYGSFLLTVSIFSMKSEQGHQQE